MKKVFKKMGKKFLRCGLKRKKSAFTLPELLIVIGIVGLLAVLLLSMLFSRLKLKIVEVRTQQTWSILSNAVMLAKAEHGDIESWDFSLPIDKFMENYFLTVFKVIDRDFKDNSAVSTDVAGNAYTIFLANEEFITFYRYKINADNDNDVYYYIMISADVNGTQKPNQAGIDKFYFYIVPKAREAYDAEYGTALRNVRHAGLYYDGFGMTDTELQEDYWRGCSKNKILNESNEFSPAQGAFCVAILAKNYWKVPIDYPKDF